MKRLTNITLISIVCTIFFSCKKNKDSSPENCNYISPKSSLVLSIQLFNNNQKLEVREQFNHPLGYPTVIDGLKLYLSNLYIHNGDDSTQVSQINLFDLDSRTDKNNFNINIKPQQVTNISFGIGVPQELNGTDNNNFDVIDAYPLGHPLNTAESGMYWTWNVGFRFVAFDGKADTENTGVLNTNIAIHTGPDQFYRYKKINYNNNFSENSIDTLHFQVHINELFANAQDTIDIAIDNEYHGTNNFQLAERFSDNFINAFKLEGATE